MNIRLAFLCAAIAASPCLPAGAQLAEVDMAGVLALAQGTAAGLAPADARVIAQAGTLDSRLKLAPCVR
ncbi:MAG: flagellar biosynthesis protein FlgA, partial [Chitinophagaceae bacterium]|nr:flagellar biosynthesis protein FlgA [Rubrivivax sp.]